MLSVRFVATKHGYGESEKYLIYDIGIDLARDYRSPFYATERRVLREMGVEPVPIYWPPSDSLRLFLGH
jgi:hypothetical protein